MSLLAKLSIDLQKANKRIQDLQASAGNMDKKKLIIAWYEAKKLTKQGHKASRKLITPSFLALPVTGEHTQGMTDLTDKRWERGT